MTKPHQKCLYLGKETLIFVGVGFHQGLMQANTLNCECLNQNHTEMRFWKLQNIVPK